MMRTKIAAVGIAVAAVSATAPAAHAYGWPGTGGTLQHFEPEIPSGALPPGSAVAEMNAGPNRYRVRFEMPAAGPARVSMWGDPRLPEQGVVVRSERGGTFRTTVESSHDDSDGRPLFLGSADQLAAFSRAALVASTLITSDAKNVTEGIELGARSEIATPDCRRLARAPYVVVVLEPGDTANGLLTCAARGARLVVVGEPRGAETAAGGDARAFARLAVGTRAVAWGFGAIAWLPKMGVGIGQVIAQVDAAGRDAALEAILASGYRGAFMEMDAASPKGVPGSTLVLVLLALYVAVIGPVGYFVGVRPRRAWLAWSWFPMIALAATIALTVGSTLWRETSAQVGVNRVAMVGPTGVGLEAASLRLEGSRSARFSISLPWRDAELRDLERGYRLGTPFSPPAGSLTVTDDRITGHLNIDGLAVGRYGTADVAWLAPTERGGAEVSWRGRDLMIINRASRPLRRAVVRTEDLCGTIDAVAPGAARTLAVRDCEQLKPSESGPERDWTSVGIMNRHDRPPVDGSFILIAESDEPFAVELTPAVAPRAADIVVVRGPVSGAGPTP